MGIRTVAKHLLGPVGLGLLAMAVLGAGYVLQVQVNQQDQQRASVLRSGPPTAVDLSAFDPALHVGPMAEVSLTAQPLIEHVQVFTAAQSGHDGPAIVLPLTGAEATDAQTVTGIAVFANMPPDVSDLTMDDVLGRSEVSGAIGPIVTYVGQLSDLGPWAGLTQTAFARAGLSVRDTLPVIHPYIGGRTAALAPDPQTSGTVFGKMSKIAGVLGLLALAQLILFPNGPGGAPVLMIEGPKPPRRPRVPTRIVPSRPKVRKIRTRRT